MLALGVMNRKNKSSEISIMSILKALRDQENSAVNFIIITILYSGSKRLFKLNSLWFWVSKTDLSVQSNKPCHCTYNHLWAQIKFSMDGIQPWTYYLRFLFYDLFIILNRLSWFNIYHKFGAIL